TPEAARAVQPVTLVSQCTWSPGGNVSQCTWSPGGNVCVRRVRLSGEPALQVRSQTGERRPPSHQRGRVSSKADDFDVRFRDAGPARRGRPADGGIRGNASDVDYDLGYDDPGWDTQGFRRPEADYLESADFSTGHEPGPASGRRHGGSGGVGTAVRPGESRAARGHREASHARPPAPGLSAASTSASPSAAGRIPGTEDTSQLGLDPEATGLWTPEAPVRGRRAAGGPGGPGGPGG